MTSWTFRGFTEAYMAWVLGPTNAMMIALRRHFE